MSISALHERSPLSVTLSDGSVRNDYTVRFLNKAGVSRSFALEVLGVPAAEIRASGIERNADGKLIVEVGPDQSREFRVLVNNYEFAPPSSTPITFHLRDLASGVWAQAHDNFRAPERPK